MKKLLPILLILGIILSAPAAPAESIFDLLEEESASPSLLAPSYGALANVDPDAVEKSADGGRIVTYRDVGASGVNDFGTYLGKLGFTVSRRDQQDQGIAYAVSDGKVSFVMIYNQAERTMRLIYPQGTDYAKALFPGFTRIEFNEEISVPGLGRFTFRDLVLNDAAAPEASVVGSSSWLPFSFFNTSTSNQTWEQASYHSYFSMFRRLTLVYRNDDADYEYVSRDSSAYDPVSQSWSEESRSHSSKWYIEPLNGTDGIAAFTLPESLRASVDGTIAIRLEFVTGEKYVLIARENGKSLNIASPTVE